MISHTLTLYGQGCAGGKPSPSTVGPLLSMLGPLFRDNLRLAFYSSSRVKDRPSQSLKRAWDIRFVGLAAGNGESTELRFEAPTLGQAAPDFYRQFEMWDDAPKPEDTAFDLLGYTLSDIRQSAVESSRFDLPLLKRVLKFGQVFKHGVNRMEFGGHRLTNGRASHAFGPDFLNQVGLLADKTPQPRRVRVQGKLDMIRCSDRVFELILQDGKRVRAVWTPDSVTPVAEFLNQEIVIEGEAIFRPSGTVLRLDADAARSSRGQDVFFSTMPAPAEVSAAIARTGTRSAPRHRGFGAIAGAWPGDETIEELMETLSELGR